MLPQLRRRTARALQACAGLLAAAFIAPPALADWPAPPSSTSFETPHGTLVVQVSEYIYESKLYLDETPVEPLIQGLLDITYAYEVAGSHAALVAINDGDAQCTVHYRWVTLSHNGYRISPPVGSCSDLIKVAAEGSLLTLTTPSQENPGKMDIYSYDGKRVTHRTRPATHAEARARTQD